MTRPVVLDASALLAITLFEPGGEVVLAQMRTAPGDVLIHAVNAYEVAYKLMIRGILESAAWEASTFGGAKLVEDVGHRITQGAARIKTANMHLSMADSFCLSLGESVRGKVITSDRGFAHAKTAADVILFRC